MASNRGGSELPPQRPLKEKDFIHESFLGNPFPALISLAIVLSVSALFWVGTNWYQSFMFSHLESSPFLQVTNRDFSLFLWQFPEHMRANVRRKAGYLTGFQYENNNVSPFLTEVDGYVVAPPELLFLYHTWDRLLRPEFSQSKIPLGEFIEFLQYAEEWQPAHWGKAPQAYVKMVEGLDISTGEKAARDLSLLSKEELPLDVRMAFRGWHNYFKDFKEINTLEPTYAELIKFLESHPHYARSYWRNIVMNHNPYYLESVNRANLVSDQRVPARELAPFLRVGIYNANVPK